MDELPLEDGFRGRADLVAVSAVQSCDGRVADLDAILAAAREAGARVLVDTTQASGWLPVDCAPLDYVVCGAYKWLLAPRGTAFLAVRPDSAEQLRPLAVGWYAGDDPWTSIYGTPLRLAADARRFDVSPAWFSWAGAADALELLAALDRETVRAHNVGLADAFLAGLGLVPQGSAIVTSTFPARPTRWLPPGFAPPFAPGGSGCRSTSTTTRRTWIRRSPPWRAEGLGAAVWQPPDRSLVGGSGGPWRSSCRARFQDRDRVARQAARGHQFRGGAPAEGWSPRCWHKRTSDGDSGVRGGPPATLPP